MDRQGSRGRSRARPSINWCISGRGPGDRHNQFKPCAQARQSMRASVRQCGSELLLTSLGAKQLHMVSMRFEQLEPGESRSRIASRNLEQTLHGLNMPDITRFKCQIIASRDKHPSHIREEWPNTTKSYAEGWMDQKARLGESQIDLFINLFQMLITVEICHVKQREKSLRNTPVDGSLSPTVARSRAVDSTTRNSLRARKSFIVLNPIARGASANRAVPDTIAAY